MKTLAAVFLGCCSLAAQQTYSKVPLSGANANPSAMVIAKGKVFVAAGSNWTAVDYITGNQIGGGTLSTASVTAWFQGCYAPNVGVIFPDPVLGYLDIINPDTFEMKQRIVSINNPSGCAVSTDGSKIAVTSQLGANQFGGVVPKIMIFDANLNFLWAAPPEAATYDDIWAVSPSKFYAYTNSRIEIIDQDPESGGFEVKGSKSLPGRKTGAMELSPDGSMLLIPFGASVVAFDVTTDTSISTNVGAAAIVRYLPGDENTLYQALSFANTRLELSQFRPSAPKGFLNNPFIEFFPDGTFGARDFQVVVFPNGQKLIVALEDSAVLFWQVPREPYCLAPVNPATYQTVPLAPESYGTMFCGDVGFPNPGFQAEPFPFPQHAGITAVQITASGSNPVLAEVEYVSPTQINFLIPADLKPGTYSVQVLVDDGNGGAVASNSMTMKIASSSPGIFATTDVQGNLIGPANPLIPGSIIVIYGTGFGSVKAVLQTGQPAPYVTTVNTPIVMFGNIPGVVQFSGLTPGTVGLWQINVVVPANLPGDAPAVSVQIAADGVMSPAISLPVEEGSAG